MSQIPTPSENTPEPSVGGGGGGTSCPEATSGFYRFAAAVPRIRTADVTGNTEALVAAAQDAAEIGAHVVLFPELSLTGYTCGDLFFQSSLQRATLRGLREFAARTAGLSCVFITTIPLVVQDALFNVAVILQGGHLLGLVPKSILPNYREFYERRQFRPAAELRAEEVNLPGFGTVPIGTDLLFNDGAGLIFGVEICEDLWSVLPPSSRLALLGARVIFNPCASTELAGKAQYRRQLVAQQSGTCLCAYVLASAGMGESSQDVVYGGHAIIAENGHLLAENQRFSPTTTLTCADIDTERLSAARLSESSFNENHLPREWRSCRTVALAPLPGGCDLRFARIRKRPFLPPPAQAAERCEEILNIQSTGLAKRMEHTHAESLVIGVSGGLDSSLALLVCVRACKFLGADPACIRAVTMPGFGTTDRTHDNAARLAELVGASLSEADIRELCLKQFELLHFDPSVRSTTYENVQARTRTQLLMNLANMHRGLVVGTGDLSEIALGWSTYNGDHMSMYAVNCSVPKSLIRCLISHIALDSSPALASVLQDIIDTPVSPELLPPSSDGSLNQKTEDILGPYDLHDFFLYHFIKYGASPEKLLALATHVWRDDYEPETIRRTLSVFLRRFFSQQFKRSCIPDGPKVGTISLSPRGDWRMPTDAEPPRTTF